MFQLAISGKLEGAPPPVDLAAEIAAGDLVRRLIRAGSAAAVWVQQRLNEALAYGRRHRREAQSVSAWQASPVLTR